MHNLSSHIINIYTRLSKIFFHYIIVLVAIIVGGIIFLQLLATSQHIQVFTSSDTFLVQKTKLIAEFNKFLKQNIRDHDLKIHILQGDLQIEQGFIKSINNLVSYKGFIVPRYFYMYNTLPIKHITYFSGGAYAVEELENFVTTFVFTKKITVHKPFTRVQLPIHSSLIDDFNLSCLFEKKLSSFACNYYLNDFLDSFFVYSLSKDYLGLQRIFEAIKHIPTHTYKFCEGLSKYLLYTNDQSSEIEYLFDSCGEVYSTIFKKTTRFMEIQKSLDTQSFDTITYKDHDLNAYKLLSYQQQIYQDFLTKKIDIQKITTYLEFVRELLKKNAIDSFYKDEIYRYNNMYLSLTLEKAGYQTTVFTQSLGTNKIASLLNMITILNEGEPLLGFTGLHNEISNKHLLTQKTIILGSGTEISIKERIEKKLRNLSYLTIEKKSISDTIIDIVGYLKFPFGGTYENVKSHIILEYTNDMLLVKSIEFQNKPEINDIIKNLLHIQKFSFGELYSYIAKNLVFYEQKDAFISTTPDICPLLSQLNDIVVITCSHTGAIIDKNTIRYTFLFKYGGLEHLSISDKVLENAIKSSYTTIVGYSYTLEDIIKKILDYQLPKKDYEGTTNAIVVFENIQRYLGVKANDIADNNGKILVDLTLGGINFIVNYVLTSNTLGPRYFKDIRINNRPYRIQNIDLRLDETYQNTIHTFVIDPLTVIKQADFTAWQNYQERLKKQQSINNEKLY